MHSHREHRILILVLVLASSCDINGFRLHCNFKYDYLYECVGKGSYNNVWDDRVSAVDGYHLYGQCNFDVKKMNMTNTSLKFFPRDIQQYFPALELLDLSQNSIATVTNGHLKPHQHLRYLDLSHNQITKLESELFNGLFNLRYVALNNNNIQHVGYDIQLPVDAFMDFRGNPCINSKFRDVDRLTTALRQYCPPVFVTHLDDVNSNTTKEVNRATNQNKSEDEDDDLKTKVNKEVIDLKNQCVANQIKLDKEVVDLKNKLELNVIDLNKKLNEVVVGLNNQSFQMEATEIKLGKDVVDLKNQLDNKVVDLKKNSQFEENQNKLHGEIIELRNKNLQLEKVLENLQKKIENLEKIITRTFST